MNFNARLSRLRKYIQSKSLSSALIFNAPDVFYLTGATGGGVLLVGMDYLKIYMPGTIFEENKKIVRDEVDCVMFQDVLPWYEIKKTLNNKKTAVDTNISYNIYKKIKDSGFRYELVNEMVSRLRIQKDSDEIECIKKASSRAAEIIEGLEISDLKGKKESEIASLLTGSSWRNGCSGVAFDPVVAGGKNTAYPHHLPGEDKITSGWVKIDFGLRYKGYCSDLTRMFILSKFVNNVDSYNMLSVLKEAKQKGVDMLKPGVRCSDIYIEVKKHLDEHDIGKYFIHSLGHGVGIDVHEKPYLKRNSKTILKQSMVVTVEPGFYIPGVGGMRLEDTYLITNKGRERLTRIYQ